MLTHEVFLHYPKERRIHTRKIKQHLKRIVAATAALITATALSVTSLAAWTEHRDGVTSSGTYGEHSFLYNADVNLSWQVNLYVSTRDDGSVDPTTSNIATRNGLARVGSIFYTRENFDNAKTYVQDLLTDTIRTSTINTYSTAKNGVKIYNMPKARLVDNTSILMLNTETYFNPISLGNTINLPLSIDQIGSNYATAVKGVIEATDSNRKNTFITNVADNLVEISSRV